MQPQLRLAALAAVLTCLSAGAALAEPATTGGVRINAPVSMQSLVGGGTNAATGNGAKAISTTGSITGGVEVNAPLNLDVSAHEVTTVASGHKRVAITSVGSVHEGADLSRPRDVTVSVGRVLNVPGRDAKDPSCVIIGSIGNVPQCN